MNGYVMVKNKNVKMCLILIFKTIIPEITKQLRKSRKYTK